MKVALVFTGLLRCFEQAYPSIEKYILNKYSPDVFFNIWSEVGYYTGKAYLQQPTDEYVKLASEDKGYHVDGQLVDVHKIHSLYNPVSIVIDDFNRHEQQFDNKVASFTKAYTRPKNTAAMFYKIKQGILQLERYPENYDLIIRMRPDLILNSDVGFFDPSQFYVIQHTNKRGQGFGDGFQVSKFSSMKDFSLAYDDLHELYNGMGVSCPHLFTAYQLARHRIRPTVLSVEFITMHSPNGSYQEP